MFPRDLTGSRDENKMDVSTKPKKVEECVAALMRDPKFKPQKGKSKEESAWAVCTEKFGKNCAYSEDVLEQIMFLKGRGTGQGTGGARQGDGGAEYCVCPKCKYKEKHEKETPCNKKKCPKCGALMVGK